MSQDRLVFMRKIVVSQEEFHIEAGVLYLVSTPIGNLRDISLRALDVLSKVDLIAAEDTRRTKILLNFYDIATRTICYFDHNKEKITPSLLSELQRGKSLALVSDAGTPGISDPAFYLAKNAIEAGVILRAIPGPTAMIAALITSGLATDRFVFEGFLPVKKGRQKRLELLCTETRTIILYESPQRLLRTLQDLYEKLGHRNVAIMREITKKFEEHIRGDIHTVLNTLKTKNIKGEIVIVVEGLSRRRRSRDQVRLDDNNS